MKNVIGFIKSESVLVISAALAVVSCFFVPPDAEYSSYIDLKTISLLFSLMAVMAGFQSMFVFRRIGGVLLAKTSNTVQLAAALVMLCFFLSMFVTNDVALITFVPFAVELFKMCGRQKQALITVALQTIAANLGSMLIPPGNPQNLYLYSVSGMGMAEFVSVMLPFTLLSFVLLCASFVFVKKEPVELPKRKEIYPAISRKRLGLYIALFVICLGAVLKLIPHHCALAAVVVGLALFDRRIFARIDYGLLLTFAALFVLVGNLARIPAVYGFVSSLADSYPFAVSVGASQIISNVPAALLISGFTDNYAEILKGVNVGGLGTLIASMASLISYKIYARSESANKGKYMLVFTALNIAFLAALCALNMILY
ncbi:MAG TPA: citrate transporter [Firmicutes bacterium]|nr:citrate transporter [Bacillota bacterium]